MTEPTPVNPSFISAVEGITKSVNNFSEESRSLRDSVIAGTVQRIRYSRYAAMGAIVAAVTILIVLAFSAYLAYTSYQTNQIIKDAKASRDAQFQQSVANQKEIERQTIVASYCGSVTDSIVEFKSCLVKNNVAAPILK